MLKALFYLCFTKMKSRKKKFFDFNKSKNLFQRIQELWKTYRKMLNEQNRNAFNLPRKSCCYLCCKGNIKVCDIFIPRMTHFLLSNIFKKFLVLYFEMTLYEKKKKKHVCITGIYLHFRALKRCVWCQKWWFIIYHQMLYALMIWKKFTNLL